MRTRELFRGIFLIRTQKFPRPIRVEENFTPVFNYQHEERIQYSLLVVVYPYTLWPSEGKPTVFLPPECPPFGAHFYHVSNFLIILLVVRGGIEFPPTPFFRIKSSWTERGRKMYSIKKEVIKLSSWKHFSSLSIFLHFPFLWYFRWHLVE